MSHKPPCQAQGTSRLIPLSFSRRHPLSSFTTPKACLSSAETDKMSSDMESQLKKRLDLALEKIEKGPKSQGEVELGDWIRKMTPNVKTSVVNLSSIAL